MYKKQNGLLVQRAGIRTAGINAGACSLWYRLGEKKKKKMSLYFLKKNKIGRLEQQLILQEAWYSKLSRLRREVKRI